MSQTSVGEKMRDTEFVIKEFSNGWEWNDIVDEEVAQIFCEEELEVPSEYIDLLECHHQAIKLCLHRDKSYFREDWYVNLQRQAS